MGPLSSPLLSKTNFKPGAIPLLFSVQPDELILNYYRLLLQPARQQITEAGYAIAKGLVPKDRIARIRTFWLDTFSKVQPVVRVTWSPYMGQPNTIGFTSDSFQHHYRAVDLLWNEPFH